MIDRYLKLFEDQPANHPAVQIVRLFAVLPQATENLPKNTKTKMTTVVKNRSSFYQNFLAK